MQKERPRCRLRRQERCGSLWKLSTLRERAGGGFSPLSFSILSSERFSSHLLYKTATIGVVFPRWSSWSHRAAARVWKCLRVPSHGAFPQTYSHLPHVFPHSFPNFHINPRTRRCFGLHAAKVFVVEFIEGREPDLLLSGRLRR